MQWQTEPHLKHRPGEMCESKSFHNRTCFQRQTLVTSLEVLWLQFSDEWILTDCLHIAGTSCLCSATSCYVVAPSVCVADRPLFFCCPPTLSVCLYETCSPPASSFHMEVCWGGGGGVFVLAHLGEGHTLKGAPWAEGCHYPAGWMGALYGWWGEWAGPGRAASSSLSSRLEQETFQTGGVGSVFSLKWSFHLSKQRTNRFFCVGSLLSWSWSVFKPTTLSLILSSVS